MYRPDHSHRIAFGLAALAVVTALSERRPDGSWIYSPGAWTVVTAFVGGVVLSFFFDLWRRL